MRAVPSAALARKWDGAREASIGSIRVVRSGVAFHEQASLPLPGVKAMWSLHASGGGGGGGGSGGGVAPARLVLSFVSETRLLARGTLPGHFLAAS